MKYATGYHDAINGRERVAMHGAEYARGYMAGLADNIKTAGDLWELHQALIAFEAAAGVDEDGQEIDTDIEVKLKSHDIDICELPTFGGPEPKSTSGVWSWNADSLLVGKGPFSEWEIRDRP